MKIVFILSCCFREYSFKHVSLPVADRESVEKRSTTEDVLESRRTGGAKMATHTSTKSSLSDTSYSTSSKPTLNTSIHHIPVYQT